MIDFLEKCNRAIPLNLFNMTDNGTLLMAITITSSYMYKIFKISSVFQYHFSTMICCITIDRYVRTGLKYGLVSSTCGWASFRQGQCDNKWCTSPEGTWELIQRRINNPVCFCDVIFEILLFILTNLSNQRAPRWSALNHVPFTYWKIKAFFI